MPAIQSDDSDEEAPNAPRLARPRTSTIQKPLLDEDDDLIVEDDVVAAPQGALKKRLQKARQPAPTATSAPRKEPLMKGPRHGSGSAAAGTEDSDDEAPIGREFIQHKVASGAASDSEEEPISAMKPAAKYPSSDPETSDPDSDDEEAWMTKKAVQSSSRATRFAKRGTAATALSDGSSQSESEDASSDSGSDEPSLSKKSNKLRKSSGGNREKKTRAPKPRKRSPLSDSEGDEEFPQLTGEAALKLQERFSDAPRPKAEQQRKLPSRSFLVLGCMGKRGTWELPYKDMSGKINLELLKIARDKVLSGKNGRSKKELDYSTKPELKQKVEALWRDARQWHRLFGRPREETKAKPGKPTAASKLKAAKPTARGGAIGKGVAAEPSDSEDEPLGVLREGAEAAANPELPPPSDSEDEQLGDLRAADMGGVKSKAVDGKGVNGAGAQSVPSDSGSDSEADSLVQLRKSGRKESEAKPSGDASEAEADEAAAPTEQKKKKGSKPKHAINEEDEMLEEVTAAHEKAATKDKFWRREADFIADDDEMESDDEGEEGEGYLGEEEALECNERGGPMNFSDWAGGGRLDDDESRMLSSETQRLLRQNRKLLPCRKDKTLKLGNVLAQISQRHAILIEETQALADSQQAEEEEEDEEATTLRCVRCTKQLTDQDDPIVDRFAGTGCSAIFCSQLCIRLHRTTLGAEAAAAAAVPAAAHEEEEDELVVLPADKRASKTERSRVKLQKLVHMDAALPRLQRNAMKHSLRGKNNEARLEDARSSGRYFESEAPMDEEGHSILFEVAEEASEEGGELPGEASTMAAEAAAAREEESEAGAAEQGLDEPSADAAEAAGTGGVGAAGSCEVGETQETQPFEEVMEPCGEGVEAAVGKTMEPAACAADVGVSEAGADASIAAADTSAARASTTVEASTTADAAMPSPALEPAGPNAPEEPKESEGLKEAAGLEAAPAATSAAAPAPAAVPAAPLFAKTFSRKPQQSKLQGFLNVGSKTSGAKTSHGSEPKGSATLAAMPQSVDDALKAAEAAWDEVEPESAAVEAAKEIDSGTTCAGTIEVGKGAQERACEAFVEGEADESGSEAAGEEEDEEGEEEEVDEEAEAEAEAAESAGPGMHMREQARQAAKEDEQQVDAIRRGLKRKGRKERDAEAQEARAGLAAADDAAASDDELCSLGDFIAESDEEDAEPLVEDDVEEEEEEEDQSAKLIRSKLGDKWVVGDRSCPLLCDDDSPDKAQQALASRFKRQREVAALGEKSSRSASSLCGKFSDERSQTLWGMLSEGQSSSGLGGAPAPKRQASAAAAATAGAGSSSAGVVPPRRMGSFQGKFSETLVGKLGAKSGSSKTSFSKGFVFSANRDDSSSHAADPGKATATTPSYSKASFAPNPATELLSNRRAEKVDMRPPLSSFNSSGSGSGGASASKGGRGGGSLLAQVLSKSKKWGASKA